LDIAALILALGIAFYFERDAKRETGHGFLEAAPTSAGPQTTAKGASTGH